MRIYLTLSPNTRPVPIDYQHQLVGAFHKWLGANELHDDISLYSLSWLSHGQRTQQHLSFKKGSTMFISSPSSDMLKSLIDGIMAGQEINWGMMVDQITISPTPTFNAEHRFLVQSPVLIKRKRHEEDKDQYYYPSDAQANQLLTDTMQRKMERYGLSAPISVGFDPTYAQPRIKMINYKNIAIKATYCPVIIKGDPEAIRFAWEVGVGNSTGIGFGALV